MLVSSHKEKLIEAISYFVKSTKYCGAIKLFKLLYWLDYHHFRETGRSVTGLEYFAYPMGPVPTTLYDQIKNRSGDIADHFSIELSKQIVREIQTRTIDDHDDVYKPTRTVGFMPATIKPRKPYKHRFLTKREMRIAETLAEIFKDVKAEMISDISHIKGGPWQLALKKGGEKSLIDFMSSLVPMQDGNYLDEEELRHKVAEYEDIKQNLL